MNARDHKLLILIAETLRVLLSRVKRRDDREDADLYELDTRLDHAIYMARIPGDDEY